MADEQKTNGRWRILAGISALVAAMSAGAEGVSEAAYSDTWTNNAAGVVSWEKSDSSWLSGKIPVITNSIPHSTNLTVYIDHWPDRPYNLQTIRGPWSQEAGGGSIAWALGALVGGKWTAFEFYYNNYCRPLLIRDPSRYEGVWQICDGNQSGSSSVMVLQSDAAWTSTVNRVNLSGRMGFRVPSGATAALEHPFGEGFFEVNRAYANRYSFADVNKPTDGTLDVRNSPGGESYLRVRNGMVKLHGRLGGDAPALAEGAALRLDASAADTLVTVEEGGRTRVTRWNDADGRPVFASAPTSGKVGSPTLAADAVTRRPVVDFGKYADYENGGGVDDPVLGQTASMSLSQRLPDVRELFVVFRDKEGGTTHPQFVGCTLREDERMYLRVGAGTLFCNSHYCQMPLRAGEVRVNDRAEPADAPDDYTRRLTVASAGLNACFTNAAPVHWIAGAGTDRRNGGIQIAEIVLYTNALTTAQRRQNNAALMRKWLPEAEATPWDYGAVWFDVTNAVLDVAEGVVSVREVKLADGSRSIVKRGPGTLVLGRIAPNDSSVRIEVEEGNVRFVDHVEKTETPQPAADPFCWFDAAATGSFTMTEDGASIEKWNDRRDGTNHYGQTLALARPNVMSPLTNSTKAYLAHPTFDAAAANGRGMVDLGTYVHGSEALSDPGDTSSLWLYKDGTKQESYHSDMREGWLVYFKTHGDAATVSSQGYPTFTGPGGHSKNCFVRESYCHSRTVGGYWRYDGRAIDPTDCPNTAQEVHVLSFRFAHKLGINSFGNDRGSEKWQLGGVKIGEVLYYDRLLTEQERRDTEAYLLRKWKGAASPQDAQTPCAAEFWMVSRKPDATMRADDAKTTYARVVGALDGTFAYTGAGATVVTNMATSRVRAIEMRGGGSLDIAMDFDVCSNAWFHVDATRADTMDFLSAETNAVDVWRDVRDTGVSASAIVKKSGAMARPFRCETDVNGTERRMPVVDFGEWYNRDVPTNSAASMEWSERTALQEFYVVQRDKGLHRPDSGNELLEGYPCLLGQLQQNVKAAGSYYDADSDQIAFFRNSPELLCEWATRRVYNGHVGVNGEKSSGRFRPVTNEFYVYSFQLTNVNRHVQTFARRDGYQVGGQQIGEMVCFAETNSVERRTQIENYLMRKWFGPSAGAPATWSMDSISFFDANALTLRVPEWQKLSVASFTTVFDGASAGSLHVDGAFALPETGTWTVDVAADRNAVVYGVYPLLTATSAEGLANLDNWNVSVVRSGTANVAVSLRRTAAGISLVVSPAGTLIVFR